MTKVKTLQDQFDNALFVINSKLQDGGGDTGSTHVAELSKELSESRAELNGLISQIGRQKDEFLQLSEDYGNLELKLIEAANNETAKEEAEALESKIETLKEQVESKKQRAMRAEENNKGLIAEIEDLKNTLEEADNSNELAQIKEQHSADIAKIDDIVARLKPLVEE